MKPPYLDSITWKDYRKIKVIICCKQTNKQYSPIEKPGKCAAPPAPAMIVLIPLSFADRA